MIDVFYAVLGTLAFIVGVLWAAFGKHKPPPF